MSEVKLVHCTPEKWLPIVGYEGLYEVSDQGRVRSVDRNMVLSSGRRYTRSGRIMSFNIKWGDHPYRRVKLCSNSKPKLVLVSRLVLTAFVRPPKEGEQACHCDNDPSNNALSNLRWDTIHGNYGDRESNGTHPRGENNNRARLTVDDVMKIRAHQGPLSELAQKYGMSRKYISQIRSNRTWKHV